MNLQRPCLIISLQATTVSKWAKITLGHTTEGDLSALCVSVKLPSAYWSCQPLAFQVLSAHTAHSNAARPHIRTRRLPPSLTH